MTQDQQKLWDLAGRLAYRDVAEYTEGKFTDLFYRVALDYYTKLLLEDNKNTKVDKLGKTSV